MRVVQLANFVSTTSGGLRTTLGQLAEGYAADGHSVVQLLPGPKDANTTTAWGQQRALRSPALPGTGYRVVLDRARLRRALEEAQPDVVEVHDRTTLRWVGPWARAHGVPALVVSHERLDRWLEQWLSPTLPLAAVADRSNRALAHAFDAVVCTTPWAAEEFHRLDGPVPKIVPLAADTAAFRWRDAVPQARNEVRLVLCSRLSREKRPGLAVDATSELLRRGRAVRLTVAGDGPLRRRLQARSVGLPVEWLGHVTDRNRLADVLAGADVALAPGPVETFGLAALEALACGTPVVADARSAVPGVLGPGVCRAADGTPAAFADAVEEWLARPESARRAAARARAEEFGWDVTVRGFLAVHAELTAGVR
jgi:alpha-1,6-mannosyltransferase